MAKSGNVNWAMVAEILLDRANQMPANPSEPAFAATVVLTELAKAIQAGTAFDAAMKTVDKLVEA